MSILHTGFWHDSTISRWEVLAWHLAKAWNGTQEGKRKGLDYVSLDDSTYFNELFYSDEWE